MDKVKVSAVSYTNMLPFIYGLEQGRIIGEIDLYRDVPSECARKLIRKEADLGILPVAALLDMPDYYIVSDYCLGATGAVDSVFIFSEKAIHEIGTLRLDAQSKTSNALAQVLLRHYWKREVSVVTEGEADAYVQIGDRTFGKKAVHPYHYDLSLHWQKFTGLPFVFAVWVANKKLPAAFLADFNEALAFGVENRHLVAARLPKRADFDYEHYLTKNIDYLYNEDKAKALTMFLELLKTF